MRCIFFNIVVFTASILHAGGNAHGEINWWKMGSAYRDSPALGWLTITFLLFAYLIIRAIKKPLTIYLETRSKDIRKQIEEGKKAKEDAQEKLRLYEQKLQSLDQEIKKLKENFKRHADSLANEKEQQRKKAEERILKDVDETIKLNYERSKNRIIEDVAKTAVKRATEILKERDLSEVDERLKVSLCNDIKSRTKEIYQ